MNPQKMTAIKQGLEFCEFLWREVPLNDYAHEQRQQLEVALRAVLAEEGQPYHKQAQYFKSAGVGVLINPVTGDVGIGTPTGQEQEPVAWYDGRKFYGSKEAASLDCADMAALMPLYTHPPRREWQGLSEEEMDEFLRRFARYELIRVIEQALKGKNHG